MSVKFKLGFTVSAETLFTLMSKLLPIEDLSVEEVVEPPPAPQPKLTTYYKNTRKTVRRFRKNGFNPDKGVNKIFLTMLADGKPHHGVEADGMLKEAGYSTNGIYSRLMRLERHGYVFRPGKGLWQLKQRDDTP